MTKRLLVVAPVLVAATLTGFTPRESPPRNRTVACEAAAWSAPRPVPGVPAGSVVRSPSIAAKGAQVYVVGQDYTVNDGGPLPPRPLLALEHASGSIGKPAGDFLFVEPRAVVDSSGVLHVLWAEPAPGEGTRRVTGGGRLVALWYAAYGPRGWGRPQEVYRTSASLYWGADESGLTIDPAGAVHATVTDTRYLFPNVIHLRGAKGPWETHVPEHVHGATYSSIAAAPDGTLYLAYVAAEGPSDGNFGSVFFRSSSDGGRNWTIPVLVSRSGERHATSVRVLAGSERAVHLVWGQNLSGGLTAEAIRHVESHDRGASWSRPSDLRVPPSFRSDLRAALDECGAVHVIYFDVHPAPSFAERGSERATLRYARLRNGEWAAPTSPFPHLNVVGADLSSGARGALHLFMMARPALDRSTRINFVAMESTLALR